MADRRNFLKTIIGVVAGSAVGTDLVKSQMAEVEARAAEGTSKEVFIPSGGSPLSGFGGGWCAPAKTCYEIPCPPFSEGTIGPAVQVKRGGIRFDGTQ